MNLPEPRKATENKIFLNIALGLKIIAGLFGGLWIILGFFGVLGLGPGGDEIDNIPDRLFSVFMLLEGLAFWIPNRKIAKNKKLILLYMIFTLFPFYGFPTFIWDKFILFFFAPSLSLLFYYFGNNMRALAKEAR